MLNASGTRQIAGGSNSRSTHETKTDERSCQKVVLEECTALVPPFRERSRSNDKEFAVRDTVQNHPGKGLKAKASMSNRRGGVGQHCHICVVWVRFTKQGQERWKEAGKERQTE